MSGRKILIVDDDSELRAYAGHVLRGEGYAVDELEDAAGMLAHVRLHAPDVVLLDYNMPGLDGLSALRRLRARHLTTPVVMLTGHSSQTNAVQCFREGADDFIEKPFDEDFLKLIVGRTIDRSAISLKEAVYRLMQFVRHRGDYRGGEAADCICGMDEALAAAVAATRSPFAT